MRFWIRELLGWLLVALGVFIFYICVSILLTDRPRIFEASYLTFIGVIVFRGGIHLLKVAVAARICSKMPSVELHRNAAVDKPRRSEQPLEW